MKKYIILNTKSTQEDCSDITEMVFEGEYVEKYDSYKLYTNDGVLWFSPNEVKEFKKVNSKSNKKNIIKNLKSSIMVVISLISCFIYLNSTQEVQAIEKNTTNGLYVVNEYYNNNSDHIIEYNNCSFATVNNNTNTYEFTPCQLGDWNYTCNSIQELNKLIESYNSCKDYYNNYDSIYIVNQYIKNDGSLVSEYNDKSWSIQNDDLNYYEFYPAISCDYSIMFNSVRDMQKCINTYISIKETGMY